MKNILYFFVLVMVFNNNTNSQIGSVDVGTGWNLVGALCDGDTSSIITTIPQGIIISPFYEFDMASGYSAANPLQKAKGYWVKVNQNGTIIFNSTPDCGTVFYDGKIYNTVMIGTQCWLKENLDVGTMVSGISNQTNNSVIEKYCYGDDPNNCIVYGGLYQWNEAMQYVTTPGAKGICPTGWHIPTISEFQTLKVTVNNDGNALKAVGQGGGGGAGTNTSGFSALLAGTRAFDGSFIALGDFTYFWSSSEDNTTDARNLGLDRYGSLVYINISPKEWGVCVRCVKD